ncbi:MAG: cysteine-rich CWC family protein [Chitinophagaceae bacterium]|nr:cysteine-rich CWC family protein [Chitinophagaceae bacterium]
MTKHETKNCERCNSGFECRAGSITQCQCTGISLTAEERAYVGAKYNDCLCINCLIALQEKYLLFKDKYIRK